MGSAGKWTELKTINLIEVTRTQKQQILFFSFVDVSF